MGVPSRTKLRAAIACAVIASATAAAADAPAPRTLRMRRHAERPRVAEQPIDGEATDTTVGAPVAWPATPPPAPAASPEPAPAPAPAPEPVDASAPEPVDDDGNSEVIMVTSSSPVHDLFTGRAPVSVVTRADLDAAGRATLGETLQAIPAQANGGNAQVNAGGDGAVRIDLRGLGAARTLVLLNGRRLANGGSGADASVDINAIPLAMIERVEVLKDGASAIYGADAIGGVVNIITRPQFAGTDVALLTSTSAHGDGTEYDASVVRGFTSDDDRLFLVLAGSYQTHDPVFAIDRDFASVHKSYDFASDTEVRTLSLVTPSGRLDARGLDPSVQIPGCASRVCRQTTGGWTDFVVPDDYYNDAAAEYVYTPSSRLNAFITGGKKVGRTGAMFLELLYQRRTSSRELAPVPFIANSVISKDSIYNPFGVDILDFRRRITELGPRQYIDDVTSFHAVMGVRGTVPATARRFGRWKYELSFNLGQTDAIAKTKGQLYNTQLADALGPSMLDPQGTPICVRVPGDASTEIDYNLNNPVPIRCIPLNLFAGPGEISLAQIKRLAYDDSGRGENNSRSALATANGQLMTLPHHGEISLALGADYRFESGSQDPPSIAGSGGSTDNPAKPTTGERGVTEGFGEVAIVPLADHALVRRLELDLGVRGLHDSVDGSHLTYKAGGLVRTVRNLALRGTYATAFRAPSFFDRYGGRTERTPAAEDPCDTAPPSLGDGTRALDPAVQARCTAQGVPVGSVFDTGEQITAIGGNPDLRPETAATTTVGVVFEPVDGLAFSADYWHVTIHDAIQALGVQTILAGCYDHGDQALCDQIHRDKGTHRITAVDLFLQNVTRTTTSGIDLAVAYDADFGARGRVRTGLEAQRLLRYELVTSQQVIHGVGVYDLGVFPRYKANLSSTWTHPHGASAGFTLRFVGAYQECARNDCSSAAKRADAHDVTAYAKLDLHGGYDVRSRIGKTSVQLGINNVLDVTPPVVYNAATANSDASAYDFVGRMVYVRMTQQF